MAVELQRLIEKVAHMDVTIIAGEQGIHNLVSWVHMIETTEATDFLQGGEIAFTTGVGLNNSTSLLSLVEHIQSGNASGMVVNIGPFIESVPQEVIDFCNEHSFPLFVIPWKIHLAEVMRIFCYTITKDDQRALETAAAFKNSIFFPKQEELYIVPLSQQGFHMNWKYSVCVMQLEHCSTNLPLRLEQFSSSIDNYARHKYKNFAVFSRETELLIVTGNYSEEQLHEFIDYIHNHALSSLASGETITMGCGKLTRSIRCVYKSYRQAKAIQKLQEKGKIESSLIFYSDMGIYKLLLGIEDKDIMVEYYNKTIRPLVEYDEKNDSDLAIVLRCYLNHNGSVKETADELFVHRNTINYKLNKASELLDMDLSSLNNRLQISVGFMLQDML
ncbi:MAG: PucR family transcriptional regulator ligand-binding domain-containing protein [Lachnospiraceae bacterium]|nr:PucR family transcriptional regulator ligand-binding domain-containing protein [Lachnospiraceae bacterium]